MPRRTHALLVCSNVLRHGAHECVRTRRAVAASHGYRAFADDVYVIGQDQEPATPSPTGQAIGDGLFNRAGPKDFGS